MAVAVPKRSGLQTAPGPSRTAAPPEPKKRPRDRPRPGVSGRSSAAAPQALRKGDAPSSPIRKTGGGTKRKAAPRKAAAAPASSPIRKTATPKRKAGAKASAATASPARKGARAATAAPARKAAPQRKKASSSRSSATAAPARKSPSRNGLVTAPSRHKAAPRRRPRVGLAGAAGHAGRAAVAVTQLPESGLIHRLTRGRAWIAVLGVLLVGIVALNVVTLSFAASAGKVQESNLALSRENSVLAGLQAKKYGQEIQRHEAAEMGLVMSTQTEPQDVTARPTDAAEAAARLAALGKATEATSE